jgi:hypothetical protein
MDGISCFKPKFENLLDMMDRKGLDLQRSKDCGPLIGGDEITDSIPARSKLCVVEDENPGFSVVDDENPTSPVRRFNVVDDEQSIITGI